jgi:hypothetical protein
LARRLVLRVLRLVALTRLDLAPTVALLTSRAISLLDFKRRLLPRFTVAFIAAAFLQ